MISYIVRRLLLMVPTLIGISFLIFMLVALSPGGVGASLRVAGGGATESTEKAVQQAYMEDRYGLDTSVFTQYIKWLGRVSPVKFGAREQVTPQGEQIRPPKELVAPPLWELFAQSIPGPKLVDTPFPVDATGEVKMIAYNKADGEYAQARAKFVRARTKFTEALSPYGRAVGIKDGGVKKLKVQLDGWKGHTPNKDLAQWNDVQAAGERMIVAYGEAQAMRDQSLALFKARIYEQSGVPIVPGIMSIGWPDFGKSFARNVPVTKMIADALPVTISLNLIAFPIIYMIALPMGIATANRAGSSFDSISGITLVGLWSMPTVWAGTLALSFLASNEYLGAFPVTGLHDSLASEMTLLPRMLEDGSWQMGYMLDFVWHAILPVACIVYTGFAVLSKQTRAAMLDNFNMDYVRTAKAKGVSQSTIVYAHVFRNSLLPVITIFAAVFPAMLAGSVVIERIFTIPGMGQLLLQAINNKDREVILANAVMIAVVNMLALLIADILYALADPRISYK